MVWDDFKALGIPWKGVFVKQEEQPQIIHWPNIDLSRKNKTQRLVCHFNDPVLDGGRTEHDPVCVSGQLPPLGNVYLIKLCCGVGQIQYYHKMVWKIFICLFIDWFQKITKEDYLNLLAFIMVTKGIEYGGLEVFAWCFTKHSSNFQLCTKKSRQGSLRGQLRPSLLS